MKRFLLFVSLFGGVAGAADLLSARVVYVLPMSRGLDQFLANRLTNGHVLQVVTDPKLADVILTDRLGEGFQAQLETISPPPEDETEPPAKDAKPPARDAKPAAKNEQPADTSPAGIFGPTVNKLPNPAATSTFGHNKGTIFLVDAKSRQVLWSIYQPPRNTAARELDRTASEIVSRLKKDLRKK